MNWNDKNVLVTGGASFIGSHLVDALIKRKAKYIRVIDNLSSGKLENIQKHLDSGRVHFILGDLLVEEDLRDSLRGEIDIVFHLAADHGGRGYVDLHQVACAQNLWLDGQFFAACEKAEVEKIIYASSGCIYPNYKQTDLSQEIYLKEDDDGRTDGYDSDNLYGWAKLMAEFTLKAYHQERNIKTVSLRFFTVYGERGKEDHAIIAMIARAFVKQDPFEIWGDGQQIRNWTNVSDIVEGFIRAAERIENGIAINLGTDERIQVFDAAQEVVNYVREKYYPDYEPQFKFLKDMPVGPVNRVADNSLAKALLGWEPKIKFLDGLHKTIDWYFNFRDVDVVRKIVKEGLTER